MSEAEPVFELVDEIETLRPFVIERVVAAAGLSIAGATIRVGQYFRYGTAADHGTEALFTEVEVRQRLVVEPGRDGIVILSRKPEPCIDGGDVMARYGADPALSVPTPHQPPESPIYFVYARDWGKLSFGFARDGSDCLLRVVLDATGS